MRHQTREDCSHQWVPIEFLAGKRVYQADSMYIDWTANIINAHILRVTKLYCAKCDSQREVPSDSQDK